MCGNGDGVALDYGQARAWFEKHLKGSKSVEDYVNHLIGRMNRAGVRAIRERMTAGSG